MSSHCPTHLPAGLKRESVKLRGVGQCPLPSSPKQRGNFWPRTFYFLSRYNWSPTSHPQRHREAHLLPGPDPRTMASALLSWEGRALLRRASLLSPSMTLSNNRPSWACAWGLDRCPLPCPASGSWWRLCVTCRVELFPEALGPDSARRQKPLLRFSSSCFLLCVPRRSRGGLLPVGLPEGPRPRRHGEMLGQVRRFSTLDSLFTFCFQ